MDKKEVNYEQAFKNMLESREQLEQNIENTKNISYEEQVAKYMKYVQTHNVKKLGASDGTEQ